MSDVPFDVVEEISVGDLTAVQQSITPQAQDVKVRIDKATVEPSKDKALKTLKTSLRVVDGIPVFNQETGENELKFQNKPLFPGFMDLVIWADPAKKTSQWYKNKQHLLGLKQFCQALEIDIKDVKINDEFCSSLIGRELLCSIKHEEETTVDATTGERVKTGSLKERIHNFKKSI